MDHWTLMVFRQQPSSNNSSLNEVWEGREQLGLWSTNKVSHQQQKKAEEEAKKMTYIYNLIQVINVMLFLGSLKSMKLWFL